MVSLSRYAIRFGLIIGFLIVVSGLITSSFLINQVQNNVNVIENLRIDHNSLDQKVQDSIFEIANEVNKIFTSESQLILANKITGDTSVLEANRVLKLRDNYTLLQESLLLRETENYNLSGLSTDLNVFGVLNNQVPDVGSIIDKTDLGVNNYFSNFIKLARPQLEGMTITGADLRSQLNNKISQLLSTDSNINSEYLTFQAAYNNFTTALFVNGTTQAADILNLSRFIYSDVTNLTQNYSQLYSDIFAKDAELNLDTFQTSINATMTSIIGINSSILNLGLNSQDSIWYGKLSNVTSSLFDSFQTSISEFDAYFAQIKLMKDFVSTEITPLQNSFVTAFTYTHEKIAQENNKFNVDINNYIKNVHGLQNIAIVLTSVVLFVIIAGLVIWIFIALTRNFPHIISKIEGLEKGDLRISRKKSYANNEIGEIEKNLDNFTNQIRGIVILMKQTSENLAGIAQQLAAGAEEASASISEVNATIRDFASGSTEQTLMLSRVRDELIDHLDVVEQTTNRIDETTQFVLNVANRTNILGLNASIEAAKAGRFGLGFNVVAEEVRDLSNDTRVSARDIKQNIEEIEYSIRQTVEDILTEVNIIREVAQNTSTGSDDASQATAEQVTMMNEVSATSNQLSDISQQLIGMMHKFQV